MFDSYPDRPADACVTHPESPMCAADVVRGVTRLLVTHDLLAIGEVPLECGRRADLMAIDPHGGIVIVEVKVSRADLLGDGKWPDYLGWCDRYFWAVPAGFDRAPLAGPGFLPDRCGIVVADRYGAEIVRDAATVALSAAVRRRVTLAFARRAARRVIAGIDPDALGRPFD